GCGAIAGATAQTYVPVSSDVGHTLRVSESAGNAAGWSGAQESSATQAVTSQQLTAAFGKTAVGKLADRGMFANYKIVHRAALSQPGSVTKLSVYAIPGIASPSPQALRAVIYADAGGTPGALLASGPEVSY